MRRRRHRRRVASLLLWGTLVVVFLLGYLNANPIRLGSGDERVVGRPERGRAESDVLIVGSPAEIVRSAESGRFDEVDWSWTWVDMMAAEVGPVSTCAPDELSSYGMDDYRFVVITHSAMAHPSMSDSALALEQFVNRGGVLVLERPEGVLRELFSADGRGGLRTPRGITGVAGVGESLEEALRELPLFSRYVGSTAPLAGSETLMSMDGAPVFYRLRRAAGTALTVDFNLGLALVSLHQGRPTGPGFEVEASDGEVGPTVADLIASDSLRDAEMPFADLLSAAIVMMGMAEAAPLVSYWPYPNGVDGVVLLTHDVPANGDRSIWLAEHESEAGATASFYFGYSGVPEGAGVDRLRELEAELAILWERGDSPSNGNRRLIGLGGLRPLYRLANLAEHQTRVGDMMGPGLEPQGVRSRDGLWTDSWAGAFQSMAALGLRYDSSFGLGPGSEGALPAFRHGTGRLFQVTDENGLPLGLYEAPVVVPSLATEAQRERLEDLLRESQRSLHQTITVQVSADMFERDGALNRFDAWQWLIEEAQRRNHALLNVGRFVDFSDERRQSDLRSHVVEVTDPDSGEPFVRLEIRAAPQNDRLWLRVPRDIGERRAREVIVRRQVGEPDELTTIVEATEVRNAELLGVPCTLVELLAGEQQVEVTYR